MPVLCEGEKNIIHYALYKKPWQDDDVTDGEIFWHYAEKTPFYNLILERKASFGEKDRKQKEIMAKQIRAHAFNISKSEITFAKMLEF
jgi:lipopolysaccharide biosynthesis glycosyltransferase